MSFLDRLTDNQRQTLIRLPYRVGLYVSRSDQSGGAEAEARERAVLANILNGFSEDVFGSESMQYVMTATVRDMALWPQWEADLSSVPHECNMAVDVLGQFLAPKDVTTLKNHLMEIAEAVAMAFSEHESGAPPMRRFHMKFIYAVERLRSALRGESYKSFETFSSISLPERLALCRLANAMGRRYG
jgi:hypothetical protein